MMMTIAHRYYWSVGITVFGVALSALVTWLFAEGLPASKPIALDGIGIIEVIQLPEGARKLGQIHSFLIQMDDVDDFGRVFINNYVALMTSGNEALFDGSLKNKIPNLSDLPDLRVSRSNPSQSESDIQGYLRPGKNFLVVELENSMLGGCRLKLNVTVNGRVVEGFPGLIPKSFQLETSSFNTALATRFATYSTLDVKVPWSGIPREGDALCSRRVFQFNVLD